MGAETIVTLIAVAVLVGALAAYLIIIASTLNRVSFTLGTILIGVRAIENQTRPLPGTVGSVAEEVLAIEDAMSGISPRRGGSARRRSSSGTKRAF